MKEIKPSSMDENFGVGCAEEHLDHITIEPTYNPQVAVIVAMSRLNPGGFVNWIDAFLPVMEVMRDKAGAVIDEECTESTCRVENGLVTVVIEDRIGNKAKFELGKAEEIWPELENQGVTLSVQ